MDFALLDWILTLTANFATTWYENRPIYHRLPIAEGRYQVHEDDTELEPVADWLTAPLDANLLEVKAILGHFYRDYLDPLTTKAENLDWLAQLVGFTGEYWETNWTETQKRTLIKDSLTYIWENKGTRQVLEYLLGVFAIAGRIYQLGQFLAGRNVAGDTLGGENLEYFLLLPLRYLRTSYEWRLANKTNRLYSPVFVDSRVMYSQFYCGFSVAGDAVFNASVAIE